jgi:FkbM family methyltransferase
MKRFIRNHILPYFPSLYKRVQLSHFQNISWTNLPSQELELLLLDFFLEEESIFFDVGANEGLYGMKASESVNPNNVYLFEPIPVLYKNLKLLLKKAKHFKIALSNEVSDKQFKIPYINNVEYQTRGTLNTTYVEKDESKVQIIDVKTDTLDNFVKEQNVKRIDLIKIDVEGHENTVLEGGKSTLENSKPVLFVEIEQRHHTESIQNIVNNVLALNYKCYYFEPSTLTLKELDVDPASLQDESAFKSAAYINNFIFLPDTPSFAEKVVSINSTIQERIS